MQVAVHQPLSLRVCVPLRLLLPGPGLNVSLPGLAALLVFDSVARHCPLAVHRPQDLPFWIGYIGFAQLRE